MSRVTSRVSKKTVWKRCSEKINLWIIHVWSDLNLFRIHSPKICMVLLLLSLSCSWINHCKLSIGHQQVTWLESVLLCRHRTRQMTSNEIAMKQNDQLSAVELHTTIYTKLISMTSRCYLCALLRHWHVAIATDAFTLQSSCGRNPLKRSEEDRGR
jgi:hypothetical protein